MSPLITLIFGPLAGVDSVETSSLSCTRSIETTTRSKWYCWLQCRHVKLSHVQCLMPWYQIVVAFATWHVLMLKVLQVMHLTEQQSGSVPSLQVSQGQCRNWVIEMGCCLRQIQRNRLTPGLSLLGKDSLTFPKNPRKHLKNHEKFWKSWTLRISKIQSDSLTT